MRGSGGGRATLRRMEEVGLYADPAIYDILHTPRTADEVDGLERTAKRFVPGFAQVWLEPACGSGRYLRVAAGRGREVIGFDLSPAMVAYAERRVRRAAARLGEHAAPAHLFVGDMTDFAGRVGRGRVDLAFNLINTIRHLHSDDAVLAHLEQIARVLKRGGVYLVGLSTSVYGLEGPSEDVWEARRGPVHVRQVVQFDPPTRGRFEMVHSHLTIVRGQRREEATSRYALRCYTEEQWRRLVSRSPLQITAVVDEDGDDHEVGGIGYGVYVLKKAT